MTLIDRILKRAEIGRAGAPWLSGSISYYKISAVAAGKLAREAYGPNKKPPKPGYALDLPPSTFHGYSGHWAIYNRGGKYELMFHQRG